MCYIFETNHYLRYMAQETRKCMYFYHTSLQYKVEVLLNYGN
ncbi:hypothetical protein J2S78_002667 [Salibacterium salarium]|nr:hypothetical protein [Salibacterium salarium]